MLLYLHGFASGPASAKAQLFKRRFAERGLELQVPALDEGDFEHLTLARQLQLVERLRGAAGDEPCVLIGSSLGGYLAALDAARRPPAALVLLAPAFDFAGLLRALLGEGKVARWRERGCLEFFHYVHGRELPVDYGLLAGAEAEPPMPRVEVPTQVLHGRHDEVVPPAGVERWVAQNPTARLVQFEAGHSLAEAGEELFAQARAFLASQPALARAMPSLGPP